MDVRHKAFEFKPGDISTWSDYAERFGFDPDGQIQNEFSDNNRSLSIEGWCLDRFIKQVSVSSFYDNGGGKVHQYNDKIRDFHLHLSDSKLQNSATTTAHIYTLLGKKIEKKTNDKRYNNVGSNRWMPKAVYVFHCLLYDVDK